MNDLIKIENTETNEIRYVTREEAIMMGIPSSQLPKTKGLKGVKEDIVESIKNIPEGLIGLARELPKEAMGVLENPERIPQNILAGLGEFGHGVLSTPGNIRDYLAEKELIPQNTPSLRLSENILPKEFDYGEGVGLEGDKAGDALIRGLVGSAPYVALGELGALGRSARTGARAAAQAGYAVGQNEDPLQAALMVPAIEVPLRGAIHGARAIKPAAEDLLTKAFRGRTSPQELAENARISQGTNTSLADIVDSPYWKKVFENITTQIPFSGGEELLGKINNQVTGKAEDLMERVGRQSGMEDPNAALKESLIKQFKRGKGRSEAQYKKVENLANKEGIVFNPKNSIRAAQEYKDLLNENKALQNIPRVKSTLAKLGALKDLSQESIPGTLSPEGLLYKETQTPSMSDLKFLASALSEESKNLSLSSNAADRAASKMLSKLANTLREDVATVIESKGSPQLRDEFKRAEVTYKTDVVPFLKNDIYKLLSPYTDADSIGREIIKPSKKGDRFSNIERVQELLPESKKNLLGHALLNTAMDEFGNINPKELASLARSLGTRQFQNVFGNESVRKQVRDFGKLRGMNEEALSAMANPKTGARLNQALLGLAGGLLSGAAGIPATAALMGTAVLGAKGINKFMTSPAVRERLIQNMLDKTQQKQLAKIARQEKARKLPPFGALSPLAKPNEPFMQTENYDFYD